MVAARRTRGIVSWPTVANNIRRGVARKLIQLQHPEGVTFKCPSCNGDIANFDVLYHFESDWTVVPFACPNCGSLMHVSTLYAWSVFGGLSALALVVPVAVGIRPWYLWVATAAISWAALSLLSSVYVKVLFPPRIRLCAKPRFPADRDGLSLNIRNRP
jgi:predicted RNA-binding Zn-ribbon protein involved in translation (DUF1610 family)